MLVLSSSSRGIQWLKEEERKSSGWLFASSSHPLGLLKRIRKRERRRAFLLLLRGLHLHCPRRAEAEVAGGARVEACRRVKEAVVKTPLEVAGWEPDARRSCRTICVPPLLSPRIVKTLLEHPLSLPCFTVSQAAVSPFTEPLNSEGHVASIWARSESMGLFSIPEGCCPPNLRLNPFTDFENETAEVLPYRPIRQDRSGRALAVSLLQYPCRFALADWPLPIRPCRIVLAAESLCLLNQMGFA
ncbi:hypothetical protein Taro_003882 [Colocasia esculenta]|uniref:Uncharacterized protein n=1 Tax=Colocasia esculenta TaxID=4460 RepID=A0A843TQ72_COLES|nr:hypothetical protein [Colocasia esculenta]